MRRAWAPLLFADEELPELRGVRDPVAPAEGSASVQRKKWTKRTPDGLPVHSFHTLLNVQAIQCRNRCRIETASDAPTFEQLTEPATLQQHAYELLQVQPVTGTPISALSLNNQPLISFLAGNFGLKKRPGEPPGRASQTRRTVRRVLRRRFRRCRTPSLYPRLFRL